MSIRILTASDAQVFQQLRLSALKMNPEAFGSTYEREVHFTLDTIVERLTPSDDKFVLGAFEEGGSLVGLVSFVRESGQKTAHKGNVYGMFVAPEWRGKGLGKSLLLELISKAKKCDGVEQLNLVVVSSNDSAKKLYESIGFEVYGKEKNALKFEGEYFDEDLMVLKF